MDAAEVIAHIGWTQGNHVTIGDVVALIRSRALLLLKTPSAPEFERVRESQ
jgi:hypothetical protein